MTTKLLVPTVVSTVLDGRDGEGESNSLALPSRACIATWSLSYDSLPSAIEVTLEVSLDGTLWTVVDTATNVDGELRLLGTVLNAKFIRINVVDNPDDVEVTARLLMNISTGSGGGVATASGEFDVSDASGASLVFTQAVTPEYYLIGELCHFYFDITFPVTANGLACVIHLDLPVSLTVDSCSNAVTFVDVGSQVTFYMDGNDCLIYKNDGTQYINSEFSGKTVVMAGIGRFTAS